MVGMPNTIEQYRQAKSDIAKLHSAAKKELVGRFNELSNELLLIQKELREEFGVKLSVPSKAKASRTKVATMPAKTAAPESAAPASPEITRIEKQLALQKRKLDEAAKAGKPDKAIKDRIYELEDDLRLAKEK